MGSIETVYLRECARTSDINEHLPTLRQFAAECTSVTEFGVRTVVSTWAFLAAHPKLLRSYDLVRHPNVDIALTQAKAESIDFKFQVQDVIAHDFFIEPTDLLFFDTLHTFRQLSLELAKHAGAARKYMIFHDTVTFGHRDEGNSTGPGLVPAISAFLDSNPGWQKHREYANNNGLTILGRTRNTSV